MSGFSTSSWGGFLKQAMSTVENRLINGDGSINNTETFVDPITGIVATIQRQPTTSTLNAVPGSTLTISTGLEGSPAAIPAAPNVSAVAMPIPKTTSSTSVARPASTTPPTSTAWRAQKESNMKRSTSDLSSRLQAIVQEKARGGATSTSPSPLGAASIAGKTEEREEGKKEEGKKEEEKKEEEKRNVGGEAGGEVGGEAGGEAGEEAGGEMEGEIEEVKGEEKEKEQGENKNTERIAVAIVEEVEKEDGKVEEEVVVQKTMTAVVKEEVKSEAELSIVMEQNDGTGVVVDPETNLEAVEEVSSKTIELSESSLQDLAEPTIDPLPHPSSSIFTEPVANSPDPAAHFQMIILQRERQLLSAMEANAELNTSVQQLREAEAQKACEIEFMMAKVTELEKQVTAAAREMEAARVAREKSAQQLQQIGTTQQQKDAGAAAVTAGLQKVVEEQKAALAAKDEQITGLLAEGEKLSKNELKHMTTIKKLRAEKTEADKTIAEMQKKVDKASGDQVETNGKLAKMMEAERKLNDSLKTLTETTERQAKQTIKLESDLTNSKEAQANLQLALDRAWQELAEARKFSAEASSQAQSAALDKEIKANERIHKELQQARQEAEETEASLRKEIRELQLTLSRTEETAGFREDTLRQDISTLQMRLQASEARNEDFNAGMHDSTRPLLRQIEALQTQHSVAAKNWDKIEKSLTVRLNDVETERAMAVERERVLSMRVNEMTTRIATLETQLSSERHEKARLTAELETERLRSADHESRAAQASAKFEVLRSTQLRTLDEAKEQYQRLLRQQLQEEREQWEQKHKQEAEREREIERRRVKTDLVRKQLGRRGSFAAVEGEGGVGLSISMGGEATLDFPQPQSPTPSSRSSFDSTYQIVSNNGTSFPPNVVIDRLNMTVRQLEGQVGFLQTQLQSTSQSRDELADELVKVTIQLEGLKSDAARVSKLENDQDELNKRYHAALEMLGERTEEVQELKADIADVKEMYRNQIVELVAKIDQLSKAGATEAK